MGGDHQGEIGPHRSAQHRAQLLCNGGGGRTDQLRLPQPFSPCSSLPSPNGRTVAGRDVIAPKKTLNPIAKPTKHRPGAAHGRRGRLGRTPIFFDGRQLILAARIKN